MLCATKDPKRLKGDFCLAYGSLRWIMILTDVSSSGIGEFSSEMQVSVNRDVHRCCSEGGVKNLREVPVHGHHISGGRGKGALRPIIAP